MIELNRAVAVSRAYGPAAGLELVDRLLVSLGRDEEARTEFERAAELTRNERERALLLGRAADCGGRAVSPGE